MKMDGNTILITGGATGIGYAMAKYFLEKDNTVIICGRREDLLKEVAGQLKGVHTVTCDVAKQDDRVALFAHVSGKFPGTNWLFNNAGVQRDIDTTKGLEDLNIRGDEIPINVVAPVYLSALFTPFLAGKENALIVNVTSGLAFIPDRAVGMPVYAATKAFLHTFSILQRKQLEPLGIKVVEIAPPMVESELNLEGRGKRNQLKLPNMMTSEEYVAKIMPIFEQGAELVVLESQGIKA